VTPLSRFCGQRRSVLAESPDEPVSTTPSSVRVLLAAGEDVDAHEVLCDNLYVGRQGASPVSRFPSWQARCSCTMPTGRCVCRTSDPSGGGPVF